MANMQRKLLLNKRIILFLTCFWAGACTAVLMAQSSHYNVHNQGVHHYLIVSLQGGEANTFASSAENVSTTNPYMRFHSGYDLVNLPGADGQFELSYELRKRNFFFSLLGNAHYTITGQSLGSFKDEYTCLDVNGDKMDYRFNYRNFYEYQQTVWVGGGLRFGYYFTPHLFASLGAKAEYPLWNSYMTHTNLETSGMWYFAEGGVESEPGENNRDYGFFSDQPFVYGGKYMVKKTHMIVSPCVEVGTRFKLGGRVSMRVAAYAEYGIPIQPEYNSVVLDYSSVKIIPLGSDVVPGGGGTNPGGGVNPGGGTNPGGGFNPGGGGRPRLTLARMPQSETYPPAYWQEREQLWATLKTGSILDFAGQKHDYNRLCVGVKLAFLFDVTVYVPHCTTCLDDSGVDYVQPKKQRRRQSTRIYGVWR